jgi:hypothetical protein
MQRLSPLATPTLAKLWRRSWMRTSGNFAFSRIRFQTLYKPTKWPVPGELGKTCGFPSILCSLLKSSSAGGPRCTTFAPVFESDSRKQARSKSTCCHWRESISFLRHPVSRRSLSAATAGRDPMSQQHRSSSWSCTVSRR